MTGGPVVAVVATLDTKSAQAAVFADQVRRSGGAVLLVDSGSGGSAQADVSRLDVEALGRLDERDDAADRSAVLGRMSRGLVHVLTDLAEQGTIDAVAVLGGGTGAALAAPALRALPFDFPKLLASTQVTASDPLVGDLDILLLQPGLDLVGSSAALELALRRAAAAIVAAASVPAARPADAPRVAVTAFGVTAPAVDAVVERLEALGCEVLVLHARGTGGRTLDRLARERAIDAVLDLTTTELVDEVAGGLRSAGPDRLRDVVAAGVPLVVVPGAIDVVNFAAPDSVPAGMRGRAEVRHSPTTTLVRSSAAENAEVADLLAGLLLAAAGPVRVLVPERGFSVLDAPGAVFADPAADAAFTDRLAERLAGRVPVERLALHITDPEFAARAVAALREIAAITHEGQAA